MKSYDICQVCGLIWAIFITGGYFYIVLVLNASFWWILLLLLFLDSWKCKNE